MVQPQEIPFALPGELVLDVELTRQVGAAIALASSPQKPKGTNYLYHACAKAATAYTAGLPRPEEASSATGEMSREQERQAFRNQLIEKVARIAGVVEGAPADPNARRPSHGVLKDGGDNVVLPPNEHGDSLELLFLPLPEDLAHFDLDPVEAGSGQARPDRLVVLALRVRCPQESR